MDFLSDIFNSIINPIYIEKTGANGVGANGVSANGVGANGVSANGVGANGVGANGVGANGVGANGVGANGVGPNESCIRRRFKPNFLEQGKTIHREQLKRSEALRPNIREINEHIIEGFGEMTASKNSAQTTETTTFSNDFDKNIDRYNREYPLFIDETRNAVKLNDRNIKDNPLLFKNGVNTMYDITYEKEGCYKSTGAVGLELQNDMTEVSADSCKMRAFDLKYSGFAIGKRADGQHTCYLSKDISQAKVGGISTKPMTSFTFKKSNSATMGGLLLNGQIGIYDSSKLTDNDLVTDLTGIEGCDISGKDIVVDENSVTATWGGNCRPIVNTITSNLNNKCIDQNKGSKDPWLQMQMQDCAPFASSQNMTYDINSQTIYAPGDNLCFDVRGFGTADGTAVIQYPCSGGTNQKWSYRSDKTLRPAHAPDKCLDILNANDENGAGLVIGTCHGRPNQTWNIKNNGTMVTPSEPRLKLTNSSAWEALGTDKDTGGDPDASFWNVKPSTVGKDTYYPLGNTIFAGGAGNVYYNTPNSATMTVAGDVKDPVGYTPITGSRGRYSIAVKRPMCPEGYFSMGDVITSNIAPTPKDIKCVPQECVSTDNQQGGRIWNGLGISTISATYNLFKANRGDTSLYSIKETCLK